MDKEKEIELFGLCAQKYSVGGMTGLVNFVDKYPGENAEEKKYLGRVRYLIEMRNHFARLKLYGLSTYKSLDELLQETYSIANPKIIIKSTQDTESHFEDITSLRIKLEEYQFKIHHQEL
ncbi:MAG: hypothetical protein AABX93_01280 [Nanoarchaeota archaeon]